GWVNWWSDCRSRRFINCGRLNINGLAPPSPTTVRKMTQLKTNYESLEEIGRGGFGVVYKARCIAKDKPWYESIVAIKKVDISKVPGFRVGLELQALASLRHENIVDFYEEFRENGAQYIVMEYCRYGSLRDYVKKNGKLTDKCAAFVLRQLVNAVKHIHSSGMMHRDLSAGNVLISSMRNGKFRVKLADFGLATLLRQGDMTGTIVGTPGYIAPQVYGRSYNQKADVFSLGGILYLMLVGKDPPREQGSKQLDLDEVSEEGAELIRLMMHPDESRRITLHDIRMSAFSRIADEFDMSGNSFRDGSREQIRRSSREYYQLSYAQPVRVRAQSAQPRVPSCTKTNKESGFESGDIEFTNARRLSLEDRCRHSLCDGSVCRRCGIKRLRERRKEANEYPCTSHSTVDQNVPGNSDRVGRSERHVYGSRRNLSDLKTSTTRATTVSSRGAANVMIWPLDISRLSPNKMATGAGRFFFNSDDSLVYEVAGRRRSVSRDCQTAEECVVCVVVVETKAVDGQVMSVYKAAKRIPFPRPDDPPLPYDRTWSRTYKSFEELQTNPSHLRYYRQIIEATKKLAGRVEKIVFKPSAETTARLMENGDFRVKFSDGRLAVQKMGATSVVVSNGGSSQATLSSGEMRMFNDARFDVLEMERLLERATFLAFKPFPFHFSNASLFTASSTVEERPSRNESSQGINVLNRLSSRPQVSAFISEGSNPRLSRKPLASISNNLSLGSYRKLQRRVVDSHDAENIRPEIEERREDSPTPRILREGEYKLRAQKSSSGKRVITSITSVGVRTSRSVRISTTSRNTYVYEVAGDSSRTVRFRFDGRDFSDVPLPARNLVYTLYRKREEYA
uniref:Protein kinase domain-containing protein n=1 Tax=Parascaris univalens TaxID=6257 RepID=A0A915BIH3_PARUN